MAKRSRRPVTPRPTTTPPSSTTPETPPPPPDDSARAGSSMPPTSSESSPSSTSPGSTASAAVPVSRARSNRTKSSNRPRRAVAAQPSFFERYRTPIIAGVGIIGVLILGFLFLNGSKGPQGTFVASGPKYTCDSLLTPAPNGTIPPAQPAFVPTPTPLTPTSVPPTAAPSGSDEAGGSPAASAAPSTETSPAATPSPTPAGSATAEPTPVPEPTVPLGFGTEILGRNHIVNKNQTINYGFCPPTSDRKSVV